MKAAAPIFEDGRMTGILYAAILLNNNEQFIDRFKRLVFKDEKIEGRDVGASTLFLGDMRVTTTVTAPSGTVTNMGTVNLAGPGYDESWGFWGVAEIFGGDEYLTYRKEATDTIVRTAISDGLTTTLATFSSLGDLETFLVKDADLKTTSAVVDNVRIPRISRARSKKKPSTNSASPTPMTVAAGR